MVRVAGAFGTASTGAGEVVGEAGAIKVTEKEGGPGGAWASGRTVETIGAAGPQRGAGEMTRRVGKAAEVAGAAGATETEGGAGAAGNVSGAAGDAVVPIGAAGTQEQAGHMRRQSCRRDTKRRRSSSNH